MRLGRVVIFGIRRHHGPVSHGNHLTSIRLPAQEALPAMRSIAEELDRPVRDAARLKPTDAPV